MCTLTFIPTETGYHLAMNRDERITRGPAVAPSSVVLEDIEAIYPKDVEGGSWIAANNRGLTFALLNWNDVSVAMPKARSRGGIVPVLVRCSTFQQASEALQHADLQGVLPFRVVGVFPQEKKAAEWRWNQVSLSASPHPWEAGHWFSSSLSDEQATARRGQVCWDARKQSDAGTLTWVRRLHASHEHGPLGLCVHRENVQTLSYAEISWDAKKLEFRYSEGSPCMARDLRSSVELQASPTARV